MILLSLELADPNIKSKVPKTCNKHIILTQPAKLKKYYT